MEVGSSCRFSVAGCQFCCTAGIVSPRCRAMESRPVGQPK